MASNKGSVKAKQQNLERMKRAIEQQRGILDRIKDDYEAGTRELREGIKDKQKELKLYHLLMNYIPREYRDYVFGQSEHGQVPFKMLTGNSLMEDAFNGKAKLLNAWREGNDPVIVYNGDDVVEERFYKGMRGQDDVMDEGDVPILGKEIPKQSGAGGDD